MELEDNIKICKLIDFYGEILSNNSLKMLKNYYFDNLTIIEIAENFKITKQAVSEAISKNINKLQVIENKLHFAETLTNLNTEINNIKDTATKNRLLKILK